MEVLLKGLSIWSRMSVRAETGVWPAAGCGADRHVVSKAVCRYAQDEKNNR